MRSATYRSPHSVAFLGLCLPISSCHLQPGMPDMCLCSSSLLQLVFGALVYASYMLNSTRLSSEPILSLLVSSFPSAHPYPQQLLPQAISLVQISLHTARASFVYAKLHSFEQRTKLVLASVTSRQRPSLQDRSFPRQIFWPKLPLAKETSGLRDCSLCRRSPIHYSFQYDATAP